MALRIASLFALVVLAIPPTSFAQPNTPYPRDADNDIVPNMRLTWSALHSDPASLTYDFYFGTETPPPLVASDANGKVVSSGVYFCMLQVGNERRTQKMVLLK